MTWFPHSTVATIVEHDNKFLMVEEFEHGKTVFNQPAGHIDADETIFEAALRETLEETAWHVELTSFLGLYFFKSPINGETYIRHCFVAKPLQQADSLALDPDIVAAHWLSKDEILSSTFSARSPLVIKVMEDYLAGVRYPLELIYHQAAPS